jgi:hypothetical protein
MVSPDVQKQLLTYADAITAFSSAQFVAYVFLLARGDCFTLNVITSIGWSTSLGAVANIGYLSLVSLCYWTATCGSPQVEYAGAIQIVRCLIIFVELILTVAIPFGIRYGYGKKNFFIDCKAAGK